MPAVPLAIVVYSAQVLVVVAVATVASTLFRMTLPSARLVYWRGVGVLCLALPLLAPLHADGPAASVVFGAAGIVGAERPVPTSSLAAGSLIVWTYAGGVAAHLGWLLLGALRLRRIRARSTPATVGADLYELRKTLAPHAEFRGTGELRQPAAFGLRRPVVLLPQQFGALDAAAQRSVAYHELLHVARRDWLWIVIEEHLRAVFWFHPAAWWVLEQVQLSREQVIDRMVVTRTMSARAYMTALVAFADERPLAPPSMAFLRRRHLKFRLQQLSKEPHMSLRRLGWTMAALVAVLGATAAGAARALPLDVPVLARQAGSATSLEIRLAEREPGNGLVEVPGPGGTRVYLHPAALATAADVTDASVIDGGDSRFSVAVRFSSAASARMASATRAHLGRPVAILLDRQVIAAATVRSPVGDSAVLTGNFTEDEARRIAAGLTRTATRPALTPGVAQSTVPRGAAPVSGSGRPPGAPARAASVAAARRGARAGSQDRDVRPPVVVSSVNPTYTQAAMDAKIEGHVLLSVVVQADGTVGDVTVTRSLDAVHGLDDQAVDAVRHWTFRPGMKDGAPVAVTVTVEMRFTLE